MPFPSLIALASAPQINETIPPMKNKKPIAIVPALLSIIIPQRMTVEIQILRMVRGRDKAAEIVFKPCFV